MPRPLTFLYYHRAKALWEQVRERCELLWIPPASNGTCDALSKQVLSDMGVKFQIPPGHGYEPQFLPTFSCVQQDSLFSSL